MITVTVSPKFQVAIPKVIRQNLDIKPGQKLQILEFSKRFELIPPQKIKDMRGCNDNQRI
jgi:AbrB family looped-hinge helix DNA binding protein